MPKNIAKQILRARRFELPIPDPGKITESVDSSKRQNNVSTILSGLRCHHFLFGRFLASPELSL